MTLETLMGWLNPFVWGFAIGFFGYPVWQIFTKILRELRQARQRTAP